VTAEAVPLKLGSTLHSMVRRIEFIHPTALPDHETRAALLPTRPRG